jgi:protein-disulfide isomerase
MLFENQRNLGTPTYEKLVSDAHLDTKKFAACLKNPDSIAQIQAQAQLGESLGVQGTPAFLVGKIRDGKLIDGELISGAQPMAKFESMLDPLLR